jgi:two-component system CheB/CheR fusion protein
MSKNSPSSKHHRGSVQADARRAQRQSKPAREGSPRQSSARGPFPIVGIGASAGGLEAMTVLLKSLPSQTGMAFVLVQHLDPTHDSALALLLSRMTEMKVSEARHNVELCPDQVYIIPPNRLMGISGRRLKLSPRLDGGGSRFPVDEFFHALAEEEGNRAIAVILSGNGSDGTQGCRAIKAAGGITFAQEEKTAKYPTMPASAITAGCVDFVLPPDGIGRELARIAGHPYVGPAGSEEAAEAEPHGEEKVLAAILGLVRQRTGVDFTEYKRPTLHRRIQRRMVLHKFESLKQYLAHLRAHPSEAQELFSDILIHVTGFFRDGAVFERLKKKTFPRIVKGKSPEEGIRIWVPGCSTGEEVYSIAMALMEFLEQRKLRHPVQVFGTDIHEGALEKARAGFYPEHIKADVSLERLRRFFGKAEGGYRINKSIREICIFARQNLVVDPPFSNLDLVSCRNVLIYLGASLQRKVMPLFHYALKHDGFLMLGASEAVGSFVGLFSLADKRAKLYQKKATGARPIVTFGPSQPHAIAEPPAEVPGMTTVLLLGDVQKQADRILLARYTPPGVVINQNLEVVQFRGRTGPYLEHAHGDASLNLLKMAREGLALDLRAIIHKAMKQDARVRQTGLVLSEDGNSVGFSIEVIPYTVPPSEKKFYLVLFEPSGGAPAPVRRARSNRRAASGTPPEQMETARLREELEATRASLQSIIESQQATNEELRSANEEILSSNEELQSTNEELETAKEELQSTNEELTTLNDELESRNAESEHVNNDLHNVLASVDIPIILLGADLRIRRFTSVAEKSFNLIPGDVGRPITDINLPLNIPDLPKLVMEVIDNLATKELEIKGRGDHWWSVRVRPYKTRDNKIEGAVMVLVDIDVVKAAAHQLGQARAFAEAVINEIPRPMLVLDQDLNVQAANEAFLRTFQVAADATINRRIYELGNGQWNIPRLRTMLESVLPQDYSFKDFEVGQDFPRIGRKKMRLEARKFGLKGDKPNLVMLTFEEVKEKGAS